MVVPPSHASPPKRIIGWLLMATGGLLALPCGLGTLVLEIMFIADTISSAPRPRGDTPDVPVWLPLAAGCLPILLGVGLFCWGRWLVRASKRDFPAARPGVQR